MKNCIGPFICGVPHTVMFTKTVGTLEGEATEESFVNGDLRWASTFDVVVGHALTTQLCVDDHYITAFRLNYKDKFPATLRPELQAKLNTKG